jgi:hypothetical protein
MQRAARAVRTGSRHAFAARLEARMALLYHTEKKAAKRKNGAA